MTTIQTRQAISEVTGSWWAFLVAATAWFVVSLVVLRLDLASVATVGVLLRAVFLWEQCSSCRASKSSSWPPSATPGCG